MANAPITGDPITGDPITGDPVTGDPVTGAELTGGRLDPTAGEVAADGDVNVERAGGAVGGEAGHQPDVGQMHRRSRPQHDRSLDAAVPPLILVLDPGGRRPVDDHDGQRVGLAGGHERGEVELRAQPAVGGQPDEGTVDVDDGQALRPAEAEHDISPSPVGGHLDRALVHPGGVVGRHPGGVPRKRHLHVGVDRRIPALKGPGPGHLDRRCDLGAVVALSGGGARQR